MKKLIKEWETLAEKYNNLALSADDNPLIQEGLFCKNVVYQQCAHELQELLDAK